jgi:hypothetical protein
LSVLAWHIRAGRTLSWRWRTPRCCDLRIDRRAELLATRQVLARAHRINGFPTPIAPTSVTDTNYYRWI